jgi:hypothetical protein
MLVRVWFEDGDPEKLRVRCIPLTPLAGRASAWTTSGDAADAVRHWLVDVAIAAQQRRADH